MVKVNCEIREYSGETKLDLKIHNHFPTKNLVTLEIDGKFYTVDGNDLKTAVDNCMNTGV